MRRNPSGAEARRRHADIKASVAVAAPDVALPRIERRGQTTDDQARRFAWAMERARASQFGEEAANRPGMNPLKQLTEYAQSQRPVWWLDPSMRPWHSEEHIMFWSVVGLFALALWCFVRWALS
jgi:hypothetical protein